MNPARWRAAASAGLLALLGPGCSTRSLADLSAGWAVDAAPAVTIARPEAGPAALPEAPPAPPDVASPAIDAQPAPPPPDPEAASDRDAALAPAETGPPGPSVAADAAVALPRVALLVGRTALGLADGAIAKRLTGLGLAVEVHEDREAAALDLADVALVFVSATVWSDSVGGALRELRRPVIVSEPFLFDDFAMARGSANTADPSADPGNVEAQQTTLEVLTPGHPLAGGLRGPVLVADQPTHLNWGAPTASALAIAQLSDQPTRIALFAYEAGSPMVALAAPARRVGFFLDLRTASDLNPSGWALFDAAVTWCLGR